MEKRPAKTEALKLIKQFGSPLFVVYAATIAENIRKYRKAFNSFAGGFSLCYSVKTNSSPGLLSVFRKHKVLAEVCSLTDLTAAFKAGFTGEQIIFDGLVKTEEELQLAIKHDISLINVESLHEAQKLAAVADKLKRKVKVGIRLSYPSSRVGLKSLLGISYDRFGVSRHSGAAKEVAEFILSCKYLQLVGLHCHTGSNQKSARSYLTGIDELVTFAAFLRDEYDVTISVINLGGGFGLPRITAYTVPDLAANAVKHLFGSSVEHEHTPMPFTDMVTTIMNYLQEKLVENKLPLPILMLEPGRSLIGNTCHLLTTIVETKKTDHNNWMIIDAGTNLMPVLTVYSEFHDIVVFSDSRKKQATSLAGPLLYSSDTIVKNRMLTEGQIGDVVMICDVGAYFNCQANQFLYPRAATVLIDQKPRLMQRRETVDDLFNRDII
ncbi:MAG: Orn/DAP/Arg decarboxylase, family 2 [Candidatus Gottesmanbacteria bacterium GW2011_GWA1_43_11]|uniref:Orn/DAP/Arg decarboxylase, family 2 n=1 Tax=Candidatus Gottesmanbacteria bacterium GW2011_GWA1_43_11 TaxID=1618436 RepID=A0A0G1FHI7_9BACT|nr:MAG: Orn/DAP/Arg decarboxylase, family 2 [Candidatus Gottesmanbacteria bacterium GW2011_GWA1_43_11]